MLSELMGECWAKHLLFGLIVCSNEMLFIVLLTRQGLQKCHAATKMINVGTHWVYFNANNAGMSKN